ncbi:MAG: UDP-2,3-diacylglucosamine diphosphatase [Saprospiraceae bacterium]
MFPVEKRTIQTGKKIYFASDFHLGIDGELSSREREIKIVQWLEVIKQDATILFLLGDQFDFWFEYKKVVPKGYVRLLGKLAELQDNGIEIILFTGNHDMWMFTYLQEEIGVKLFKTPVIFHIDQTVFFIGHGDGLGPGDTGYKLLKKILHHPVCQWLFARIHPNTGISLMQFFSGKSRLTNTNDSWNEKNEWLLLFSTDFLRSHHIDYFVFGHRHLVVDYVLQNKESRYINLGDWFHYFTYAVFDGNNMQLKVDSEKKIEIISNQ